MIDLIRLSDGTLFKAVQVRVSDTVSFSDPEFDPFFNKLMYFDLFGRRLVKHESGFFLENLEGVGQEVKDRSFIVLSHEANAVIALPENQLIEHYAIKLGSTLFRFALKLQLCFNKADLCYATYGALSKFKR